MVGWLFIRTVIIGLGKLLADKSFWKSDDKCGIELLKVGFFDLVE